jgi:hypothetical protein
MDETQSHPAIATLLHVRPSTRKFSWRVHPTMPDIWRVIEALDERGVRERELKAKLVALFGLSGKSADGAPYQTRGSDFIGRKVRRSFGKRVVVGTIVGWLPPEGEDIALWHLVHDDGDEEDLEEAEVQDSLVDIEEESKGKLENEADEAVEEADPEDTKAPDAGDGEIQFWYQNNATGGLALRPHHIGIEGLRQELLRMEGRLIDGLKSAGSMFQKDIKREWEGSVRRAQSVSILRDSLLDLEDVVHRTQQVPDRVDDVAVHDKKEVMKREGWIFDVDLEGKVTLLELEEKLAEVRRQSQKGKGEEAEEESLVAEIESYQQGLSVIGRRGRRFFDNHGKSDGTIIAFLRSGLNDGLCLWHMEHDDGDCEDLDDKEIEKVLNYFENDAQEGDEEDQSNQSGDSGPSEDEMSEDDGSEEDEDDPSAGSDRVLWPSLNIRTRWIKAVSDSCTVSELALALSSFMDYCERYGISSPDPLDASGTSLSLVSRRMWREVGRESIGRAPTKATSRSTRSRQEEIARLSERKGGGGKKEARRSSLKAAEGSRRLLRDRAAKKMVSYLE